MSGFSLDTFSVFLIHNHARTAASNEKGRLDKNTHRQFNESIITTHDSLIVSNPPYIRESEKDSMSSNVLLHEPHLALFVSNDDPLLFYKAIASKSKTLLKPHGKIFVEINEQYGREVKELFAQSNFRTVQITKDLDGKDRIVSASLD